MASLRVRGVPSTFSGDPRKGPGFRAGARVLGSLPRPAHASVSLPISAAPGPVGPSDFSREGTRQVAADENRVRPEKQKKSIGILRFRQPRRTGQDRPEKRNAAFFLYPKKAAYWGIQGEEKGGEGSGNPRCHTHAAALPGLFRNDCIRFTTRTPRSGSPGGHPPLKAVDFLPSNPLVRPPSRFASNPRGRPFRHSP